MSKLRWESQAEEALRRVPVFVRPLARRKIEERVSASGRSLVTLADFAEAEARFRAVAGGKSDEQLKSVMPAPNQADAQMVVLEACRAALAGCPNPLLDVDAWREAVEGWVAGSGLSERLRARVAGDQVLFHHKLKIAIAGCPNGCSRPQIADLALVGLARPVFTGDDCTSCGACAESCPDAALAVEAAPPVWDAAACQGCLGCSQACPAGSVSLERQGARLFLGGKLGRHPRLAVPAGQYADPARALAAMDEAVNRYLNEARPGERFAAWHQRVAS